MGKHITLAQLQTVVTGMAAKNDARFSKISDIQNSVTSTETAKPASAAAVKQAYDLANSKQDPATTLQGYGITDAYTKTEVDNAIGEVQAGALKPGGTLAASGIVSALLVVGNLGKVYNINEDFTTTADFVEGAGKALPAGTNIYIVDADTTGESPVYKFDVLSGAYGVATQSGNGLMSATDKTKLDNADVTAYTEGDGISITDHEVSAVVVEANGLSITSSGIAMATAVASASGQGGTAGAMSATDKEKLDGFTEASDAEVQAILDGIWPAS